MRRTTAALVLGFAVALASARGSAAGDPPGGSEAAPTVAEIPSGIPIALDGVVASGEWDDAAAVPFGAAGGPVLRMKQVRGTLLLAVATDRPWAALGRFAFYARAGEGDGAWDDRGAFHLDYEPFEHDRPHALVEVRGEKAWATRDDVAVVRAAGLSSRASLECAIPLSALGVSGRKPPPLRWFAMWSTPLGPRSYETVPAGLALSGPTGAAPKDLATTKRWAESRTFPDADGPGAFSRSEWDAFVAADRELTSRGAKAHGLALLLRGAEYTEATTPPEPRKEDGPILRDLLGNLAWIATKEPWTATDARAAATGLWKMNRYDEALALLLGATATRRDSLDPGSDRDLVGRIAMDAERYDDAATAYDRLADLLPSNQAAPYRAEAARARDLGRQLAAEVAARAEDAKKDDLPLARLVTSKGDVVVRLLEDDAPESVALVVALASATPAKDGTPFYAGTRFHRVVPNLFAQGGDPLSRTKGCDGEEVGSGGSHGWIAAEKNARHKPFRGAVAFALDRLGHVRGQFFVMTAGRPGLGEGTYPVFGTVVAGMDVVDRLEACDTLLAVTILKKRDHPYVPKMQK